MSELFDYNLILLGGTGARCGEIFLHMCANGYFTGGAVNLLYVDSDQNNGNAQSLQRVFDLYQKCRESYRIRESPIPCFFKPEVSLMKANPVAGIRFFNEIAMQGQTDVADLKAADALMRALYSDEECETKISDGFFARPNVGAALLAANMDSIMKQFLAHVTISQKDMKKVKIFMIGSLFGGTGASSLPTISMYLKQKLYGQSMDKLIGDKLKIGGCMALPYFSFSRENLDKKVFETDEEIQIEADKFSTKTRSALEYYKAVDADPQHKVFDSLYFLGHDEHDVRGLYDTAGSGQQNLPHIVEFYAAMSAVTFFEEKKDGRFFALIPDDCISWKDFYQNKTCFFCFYVMMRFSIVLKNLILGELFQCTNEYKLNKNASDIPWYYDFLNGKDTAADFDNDKLYDLFKPAALYCSEYVRWFAELKIKNIGKQLEPHKLSEEDGDLMDYLNLFPDSLLLQQYTNDLIESGRIHEYTEKKEDYIKLYEKNIKLIRDSFADLEKFDVFNDRKAARVSLADIWSRLSDFGYQTLVVKDDFFKNIAHAESKTMAEGVKNLTNAAYIACMF